MDYRQRNFPVIPVNKGILYDDEIWQIVAYVRHLLRVGWESQPCAAAKGDL